MTARRPPPAWAVKVLASVLPEGRWGESVLGDLHEEHLGRARASSWRAALWYSAEALCVASRYALRGRARHGSERRRKGETMGHMLGDARFALRGMAKAPLVTLLVVGTLAVGIAANAAIFSGFDALLLRPLPFPELPRLARLWETSPSSEAYDRGSVAPANFLDWQAASAGVFDRMVALSEWQANLMGKDTPERVDAYRVSPVFFETLGVSPTSGRGFRPEEGQPGLDRSLVLGYDLWQRAFAGDPTVLGRSVIVDGTPHTIVGIAPREFRFPSGAEMWAPLASYTPGAAPRDQHFLAVIGRLAPGRSMTEASQWMALVASRLQKEHPDTNAARTVVVTGLQRGYEDVGLRPIMSLWQLAAGVVLLIACVNVANLMLARGAERRRELALRSALGASRTELVRQLLTEGLVTSLLAVAVSLPLSGWAAREMREYMPAEISRYVPGWDAISLDSRTFFFSLGVALVATLFFSLVPSLRASRPGQVEGLKEGGWSGTVGASRQRGRSFLVVAQVAGALGLAVVAGLAVKGARELLHGPQGYDPERLLTLEVTLPETGYKEAEAKRVFARSVQQRLATIPGVTSAAFANILPGRGDNSSRPIQPEGAGPIDRSNPPAVDDRSVSPSYFETLRLPIVAGRALNESDDANALPVAVVSRSLADRYWPGRDPIGRRFRLGDDGSAWVTVVGVSGDVIHHWFTRRNYPTSYRPFAQSPRPNIGFALRTTGDPEAMAPAARRALEAVDPYQPAQDVWSMQRSITLSTIGVQYVAGVMSIFGGIALVLAISGVYGVMAYRVSLRTREFCVRVALGASRGDVLHLTMGQAIRLTGAGLLLGGAFAFGAARMLSSALMGTIPFHGATFGVATVLLGATALLAAYIPARRALALEPARALRAE